MAYVYQMVAGRVGTPEAVDLARELQEWHDAMVLHQRFAHTVTCSDECPHALARDLWRRVQDTYGEAATDLAFLQTVVNEGR